MSIYRTVALLLLRLYSMEPFFLCSPLRIRAIKPKMRSVVLPTSAFLFNLLPLPVNFFA